MDKVFSNFRSSLMQLKLYEDLFTIADNEIHCYWKTSDGQNAIAFLQVAKDTFRDISSKAKPLYYPLLGRVFNALKIIVPTSGKIFFQFLNKFDRLKIHS